MLEKGESYRDIVQKAKVSPNTIKAISNRAGLDESTSISSRAINYYHDYFKLLCITEFTRVYLQIKDNPWSFVNLVKLVQNVGMSDAEVVELLVSDTQPQIQMITKFFEAGFLSTILDRISFAVIECKDFSYPHLGPNDTLSFGV
jgi:hypothetical protein